MVELKKSVAGFTASARLTPLIIIRSLLKPAPRSPSHATTPTRVVGVPSAGVRNPETVVVTVAPPRMFP